MKLQHAYQEFLKEIEVRKYTPKTIRSYGNNLDLFLCFCADNNVADTDYGINYESEVGFILPRFFMLVLNALITMKLDIHFTYIALWILHGMGSECLM